MTIKADRTEVCWEPIDLSTGIGYYHDEDYWPHFKTRAKCAEAIADLHRDVDLSIDEPLLLIARPCFDGPCVIIECDGGCGSTFDYEDCDRGMHFDPDDPMPVPITECEWSIEPRAGLPDRHYCPECIGTWCDACDERHYDGCPDPSWQPVPVSAGQLTLETSTEAPCRP